MTAYQPLKKLPGHPLVVRLKKLKKSGQLHQLCLKKMNQIPSAASSEQLDEEIEVDAIPSTPVVSSPMPQFTVEEVGVEEMGDEDVDIGCTTPVMNDDFWESQHPNSPLFTPLQQILLLTLLIPLVLKNTEQYPILK